ncbi:hypothetical protein [Candidatus Nitrospira bockiana]
MKIELQFTKPPRLNPDVIRDGVRAALAEAGPLIEKAVRERTPQGLGGTGSGLRGSLFSELKESPSLFESITASSLPYAAPVEFGRRPGAMPPVQALLPWVARFVTLKQGETATGVAFAIAQSIALRGTRLWRRSPPGARMFEEGAKAAFPLIERIFKDRLGRASTRLITTE